MRMLNAPGHSARWARPWLAKIWPLCRWRAARPRRRVLVHMCVCVYVIVIMLLQSTFGWFSCWHVYHIIV